MGEVRSSWPTKRSDLAAKAEHHSATSFLNSFLREWTDYDFESKKMQLRIFLSKKVSIILPLKKYSLLGRHQYQGNYFLQASDELKPVNFEELVAAICERLQEKKWADELKVFEFKKRIKASQNLIEKTLVNRKASLLNLNRSSIDFITAEQALFVGHNFHPNPKSREQLSEQDLKTYTPELAGEFHLRWFLIHSSILHYKTSKNWQNRKVLDEVLRSWGIKLDRPQDFNLYAAHPWQFKQWQDQQDIKFYIKEGWIQEIQIDEPTPWSATSSLRSIYNKKSPYMLKFSMTLRLTNSIRHLLPEEIERGLQVDDVLSQPEVKSYLNERFKNDFEVINEPAYIGIKNIHGQVMDETLVAFRLNPFISEISSENDSSTIVLASLVQDGLDSFEKNYLLNLLEFYHPDETGMSLKYKWFDLYLNKVVRPLLELQSRFGLMLGAHQQNLVLQLKKGMPEKTYFRDCQGSGYTQKGYSLFAHRVDSIQKDNGNILPEIMGHNLFSYYLIINSTFNVIAALSAQGDISEVELLQRLKKFLMDQRVEPHMIDLSCIDYLLKEPKIMHKANFRCSLSGMNENTTKDPLSVYIPINNPLYQRQSQ